MVSYWPGSGERRDCTSLLINCGEIDLQNKRLGSLWIEALSVFRYVAISVRRGCLDTVCVADGIERMPIVQDRNATTSDTKESYVCTSSFGSLATLDLYWGCIRVNSIGAARSRLA